MPELVASLYDTLAENQTDPMTALSTCFMQDGAFIYVPRGVECSRSFVVDNYYTAEDGQPEIGFGRMLFVVENGAKANIVVRTVSMGSIVIDEVRETIVTEGATLEVTESFDLSEQSAMVLSGYTSQNTDSQYELLSVNFGGGVLRNNVRSELIGKGAESNHWVLYVLNGEAHCDVNMQIRHLAPDCRSGQLIKGIASHSAVGAFTGRVYVAKDAQRTDAKQLNRNLLLGSEAKIYADPQLEIYADDVKCSHGATVGRLDEEAVYYMRQRGLSEAQAQRLQISGFVGDVIAHCCCNEMCAYITDSVERKLEQL